VRSPGAQIDGCGVKWLLLYIVWDLSGVKEGGGTVGTCLTGQVQSFLFQMKINK
jgi:hypothetical protein